MEILNINRQELSNRAVFKLKTGGQYTIVIQSKKAVFVEFGDTLFRFNSAVLLPSAIPVADKSDPGAVEVVLSCLKYAEQHPDKKLFITAHTDSVGPDEANVKLSRIRAQAVHGLLFGLRDQFAEACWGPHLTQEQRYPSDNKKKGVLFDDYTDILSWASNTYGWQCSVKEAGTIWGGTVRMQKGYNTIGHAGNPAAKDVNTNGTFDKPTWQAVFDMYQQQMAVLLNSQDINVLQSRRSKITLLNANIPFTGCGEFKPIDKIGTNNYKSQSNRRVEVIFFDAAESPENSCLKGECDPNICELYDTKFFRHDPIDITSTYKAAFVAADSELPSAIDLTIAEKIPSMKAVFQLDNDAPAGLSPTAEICGPNNNQNIIHRSPALSSSGNRWTVTWDGHDESGKNVPIGDYTIHFTYGDASARSSGIKVIRIGVTEIAFTNTHGLKFAFNTLATGNAVDFDIPSPQWKIGSLNNGDVPADPPVCTTEGPSSDLSYSYPIAATISAQLSFELTLGGEGYDNSTTIWMKPVKPGTTEMFCTSEVANPAPGTRHALTASQNLPSTIQKHQVQFDILFETQLSNGTRVPLGRQLFKPIVIYLITGTPQTPWGMGYERLWVEFMEFACNKWAKGASDMESATNLIVEAVNKDMGLTYDIYGGADRHRFTNRVLAGGGATHIPDTVDLRKLLRWLSTNITPPMMPATPPPPAGKIWVNCTCCGAILSTLVNAFGNNLISSWMEADDGNGFRLHKIIGIGSQNFGTAFIDSNAFSYHEVAWAGSGNNTDRIFDACLKFANNPISQPEQNAIWVKGIAFAKTGNNVDDYRQRLVIPQDVTKTNSQPQKGGTYRPL